MRICLIFLAILPGYSAFSQLNDSFNDGNYTSNPAWTGSNSGNDFSIASNQLRSNSVVANSNFYLSTANNLADNCTWEFWTNLQFSTSGANYVDIYLVSDKADLQSTNINGYFVRIGNTEDEISLYKRIGARSSSVKIIDGADGSVGSSNITVRIKVTRTAGSFKMERDLSGSGTTYVNEGSTTDATFTGTTSFGVYIQQSTATFFQKHFFDDFIIKPLITDNSPPALLSAVAIDSTTIEVVFSEPLDSTSATVSSNYLLSNGYRAPLNVLTTTDATKYKLKYATGFVTANYVLTVSNVQDRNNNNISVNNTATFKYLKPFIARRGDLVINEIFADPSPQIDLPGAEFIELFNATTQTIKLGNWKFADQTTAATFPADSIGPNQYVILCGKADTAEFKRFGKVIGLSPWPSLNNSGDMIRLISAEGKSIDSVFYSDTWYRTAAKKTGGWTLERVDFKSGCEGLFNWEASIDSLGGTPGKVNSMYRNDYDRIVFTVDSIKSTTDSTLQVYFNKHTDASTVSINKFSISPAKELKSVSFDLNYQIATLQYKGKFAPGTTYQLTGSGLKDCSGNNLNIGTRLLTFTTAALPPPIIEKPDTAKIYITELLADPSPEVQLPLAEFVEIYNPGKDTVTLNGWSLSDPTTKAVIKNTFILPGQYLILCPLADTLLYQPFGKTAGLSPWPSLNNTSDQIMLKSLKNRLVDSVAYSDHWYKDHTKKNGGWTLELIDRDALCKGIQNWVASNNVNGGTPGKQNSQFKLNTTTNPLMLLKADITDSLTITLTFNRSVDSLAAALNTRYTLNNGGGSPLSAIPLSPDFDKVQLKFSSALTRGNTYRITVKDISDCIGIVVNNMVNFTEFFYPEKIEAGNILVNEILFDPRANGADFVEIYNNSEKILDLKELSIASANDKDGLINITRLSLGELLLKPHNYLVLTTDPDNIKKEYYTADPNAFIKLPALPAFNNDAGNVVLVRNDFLRIDQFNYTSKMHFPLIKNAEGISLERSSFKLAANELGNFRSAAGYAGFATPGYKNSQYDDDASGQDEIFLTSKSISPDNDGFEDVLQINYHFKQPGMVVNATVYNDKGIRISYLAKNLTLSSEGVIFWNGLDQNNEMPPVGIYMIYLEVFDLNGRTKKYRKNCVLATKLY